MDALAMDMKSPGNGRTRVGWYIVDNDAVGKTAMG
jgi:hypothetical protein